MLKNFILFFILYFLQLPFLFSQLTTNADSLKLAQWMETERNIVLLENKNQIIPLQDLDKKNIACISIGEDTLTVFQKRLSDYASVKFYSLKKNENEAVFLKMKNDLASYNLLICSVHDLDSNRQTNYGITKQMNDLIQSLTESTNTILVFFGNLLALNQLTGLEKAASIIYTPTETIDNQDLSAQLIFGGIDAKGILNSDINEVFRKGFGLQSKGGIRLKYTIPEELNISSISLNKTIDSIAESGIRNKAYPGCQILAAKDGKIFFHKAYGYHTYDSLIPVSKTDLYDLASITKIAGPLPVLMKLYDEKKIDLNSRFSSYWPEFKHGDKKEITFREVLTHQAGFVPYIPFWKKTLNKKHNYRRNILRTDSSKIYSLKLDEHLFIRKNYYLKIYKTIKKTRLKEERKYIYSDLPSILYPGMIETITKKDYLEYLAENFYKPLATNTLTYKPYLKFSTNQIIPTEYDSIFRKKLVHGYVHDESAAILGGVSGNAGLFGSAQDLAKIMQMYLNKGIYGEKRFINDSTIQEFTRCQFPENDNRRGLGFDKPLLTNKEKGSVSPSVSNSSFGHTGFTGTLCWADPENGLLYIFLSNRIYPTRNNSKIFELNIRPSIHEAFYKAINSKSTKTKTN